MAAFGDHSWRPVNRARMNPDEPPAPVLNRVALKKYLVVMQYLKS
jgi:hypothetical protein